MYILNPFKAAPKQIRPKMAYRSMEPTTGIEPVNLFLTKEALYRLSYVGIKSTTVSCQELRKTTFSSFGAGDEIRTRDIQLGRLKLYQLSYSRLSIENHVTK